MLILGRYALRGVDSMCVGDLRLGVLLRPGRLLLRVALGGHCGVGCLEVR